MTTEYPKGRVIYSRSGEIKGELTGTTRRCQLEGCTGLRLTVRWSDKKITYPCTKGLIDQPDGSLKID